MQLGDFLFYAAIVGFCFGILLATLLGFGWVYALWFLLLSGVACLVYWRGSEAAAPESSTLIGLFFLLAVALGIFRVELSDWFSRDSLLAAEVGQEVNLEGTVVREPDRRENTQHLYVKTGGELILLFADRYSKYEYGDTLNVTGVLREPEPFQTDLGRTFNYPGYLKAQGVSYVISFADIKVLEKGNGNVLIHSILKAKHQFMFALESVLPEPQVGLGEGLLLGVKEALGEKLQRIFRETGIIHIVVLSGYNIALVVIFVRYLLAYLVPYRFELGLGLLAIIAFALMVGLSATVLRASLMASFIILAKYLGRTYNVIRGLLVAGILMLIFNPYLLPYDVGFQLSFLATLGLLLLAPALETYFGWVPAKLGARELVLATISTQVFVLPILLFQMGQVSLVSVIVNLLVVPMVPIAMLLTFLTGLVSLISASLATPLVYLTHVSLSYILLTAERFSELPFAATTVGSFSFFWVVIAYVALGYWLWRILESDDEKISDLKTTELSHWTMVEEKDLIEEIKSRSKGKDNPPVFFS